jgi:hypothetical protein
MSFMTRYRNWIVAAVALSIFYSIHFVYCFNSALPEFTHEFVNSDMNANYLWAKGIHEQGWLNPKPYHPYNDWMQEIAPFEKWCEWWGSPAIYQQSPLFAYFLAGYLFASSNLLFFHFIQCLLGAVLCVLIAGIAAQIFRDKRITCLTVVIAGLYAPFYAYSFPLLRDLVGWVLIAVAILLFSIWNDSTIVGERNAVPLQEKKLHWVSVYYGIALGFGLLARETFYLTIPLILIALFLKSFRTRLWKPLLFVGLALAMTLIPLIIRNLRTQTPLLSTSNRFAENFIEGNAASAKPAAFFIPYEMGNIFSKSNGKPVKVISETLATHGGNLQSWWLLQVRKVISLFDPFEPPDNLSIYFMKDISPCVRWGLPHWIIFIPGIGGLFLGIWRRDARQLGLWLLLISLFAGILLTTVLSRYRQSLAILWIPWAAYFLINTWQGMRNGAHKKVAIALACLIFGWWLCLKPFAVRPKNQYVRSVEYQLSAMTYQKKGQPEKAKEILEKYKKRMANP